MDTPGQVPDELWAVIEPLLRLWWRGDRPSEHGATTEDYSMQFCTCCGAV